jgi:hypothetical protein
MRPSQQIEKRRKVNNDTSAREGDKEVREVTSQHSHFFSFERYGDSRCVKSEREQRQRNTLDEREEETKDANPLSTR